MLLRAFPILLLVACTIFTAVHVVQSNSMKVRGLPKALWFIIVLIVPVIGMIAWWVVGRPVHIQPLPPTAPDDDTDFLRRL
ncbi:MAG: PLD nuclease N-terminal domain-containing protein [Propionibacteriaceae bacterium]|nr:PLD nuclease N-terminal domain-containing protein [Propionibacteriaceae bacterium]